MRAMRSAAVLALGLSAGAVSAEDESLQMGRDIALTYCIECHDVSPDGPFKQEPPSFAAIAIYRSPEQIEARIIEPIHDSMPRYKDYMIGGNIDDMVRYITSLEK